MRIIILGLVIALVGHVALAQTVRDDVPNRGFYKDVYFDCGIGLTNMDSLPAVTALGWTMERGAYKGGDAKLQNAALGGDSVDWNGRLLYPDGAPRFKVMFMNGGSSVEHGASLGENCRRRIRDFVKAGGGYVGNCAGAIITGRGYEGKPVASYLGLWPGMFSHTGKGKTSTGLTIPDKSPLLRYYTYGGDKYVASVRHNQGNFPTTMPDGTETLALFDWSANGKANGKPAVVAYKADAATGRLVLCGSHPEDVVSGERRDLMAGMLRYAADGAGMTTIKGFLKNGEPRVMDRQTYEHVPEYTRIGDMQYHHFAIDIPQGARDVTVTLQGAEGSHMTLAVCKDTYAYDDCADFRSTIDGSYQQFVMARPQAGVWYVSVRCIDKVEVVNNTYGESYRPTAMKDLLNGVPYTIEVTWQE